MGLSEVLNRTSESHAKPKCFGMVSRRRHISHNDLRSSKDRDECGNLSCRDDSICRIQCRIREDWMNRIFPGSFNEQFRLNILAHSQNFAFHDTCLGHKLRHENDVSTCNKYNLIFFKFFWRQKSFLIIDLVAVFCHSRKEN